MGRLDMLRRRASSAKPRKRKGEGDSGSCAGVGGDGRVSMDDGYVRSKVVPFDSSPGLNSQGKRGKRARRIVIGDGYEKADLEKFINLGNVVESPRDTSSSCAGCSSYIPPGSTSSFCELCYNRLVKKTNCGKGLGTRQRRAEEKAFVVHMGREKNSYSISKLSEVEAVRFRKKDSVKYRLRELENAFGVKRKRSPIEKQVEKKFRSEVEWNFASIQITRVWRGSWVRAYIASLNTGFTLFQAQFRGAYIRHVGVLGHLKRQRSAATRLQCLQRTRSAQREYSTRWNARDKLRRELREQQERLEANSATSVQRNIRRMMERKVYTKKLKSTRAIQGNARAFVARRRLDFLRKQFKQHTQAALVLQSNLRILLDRKKRERARVHIIRTDAALVVQCAFRMFSAKLRVAVISTTSVQLSKVWETIVSLYDESRHDGEEHGSGDFDIFVASQLSERINEFDRDEAIIQVALWLHIVKLEFERAIALYRLIVNGQFEDPRALYGLTVALRMADDQLIKRNQLTLYVVRGKQADKRALLFDGANRPPKLFGQDAVGSFHRPCLSEVDYLHRKALLLDTGSSMRLCNYGVFRYMILKDAKGSQHFFGEALKAASDKEKNFILSCFYGKNARALVVTKEDFDAFTRDPSRPDYTVKNLMLKGESTLVNLYMRPSVSKWSKAHSVIDIMFELKRNGGDVEENPDKYLIFSHNQLKEWARFRDQPELLGVAKRFELFTELVKGLQLVRSGASNAWVTLKPALRFQQVPIGSIVHVTKSRHILSMQFFLENCSRLRLTAYCEHFDDTFSLVVEASLLSLICKDSPRIRRVFNECGWRNAASQMGLVKRVANLVELLHPVEQSPDVTGKGGSYTGTEHLLLNQKVVRRSTKETYSSVGANSRFQMVLEGVDKYIGQVNREWAAAHIQGLYHGYIGRIKARVRRRHVLATRLQSFMRGIFAKTLYRKLHKKWVIDTQATKIISLARRFMAIGTLQKRVTLVITGSQAKKTILWNKAWRMLHAQRTCSLPTALPQDGESYNVLFWKLFYERDYAFFTMEIPDAQKEDGLCSIVFAFGRIMYLGTRESEENDLKEKLEEALGMIQYGRSQDPKLSMFKLYEEHYIKRAVRIQSDCPEAHAALRLVEIILYNKKSKLTGIAKKAKFVQQVIRALIKIRVAAAMVIQRSWRHACDMNRMIFKLVLDGVCAEQSYSFQIKDRTISNTVDIEQHAFMIHAIEQDFDRSLEIYNTCIDILPTHASFRFGKALLCMILLDYEVAEHELSIALELDPDGTEFLPMISRFFQTAIWMHRRNAKTLAMSQLSLALIKLHIQNDPQNALFFLQKSLRVDPVHPVAVSIHMRYFTTAAFAKQVSEAIKHDPHVKRLHDRRDKWLQKQAGLDKRTKRSSLEEQAKVHEKIALLQQKATERRARHDALVQAEITTMHRELMLMGKEDHRLIKRTMLGEDKILTQQELAELRVINKRNKKKNRRT